MVKKNDSLLLRAMRQENQVGTFYKKMASMCKMYKNRQITVDFILSNRFEHGMNAREMKKYVLYRALITYQQSEAYRDIEYELGIHYLDREPGEVSDAQIARLRRVLDNMIADANSKL